MTKKIIIILAIVFIMTAIFMGCTSLKTESATDSPTNTPIAEKTPVLGNTHTPQITDITVGLIHAASSYESDIINQMHLLMTISSIRYKVVIKETALDKTIDTISQLVDEKCDIIFAVGVKESDIILAAKKYPDTKFELYGGMSNDSLPNLSLFNVRMYQQQYINGMVAGYITKTNNIGFIADSADNENVRQVNAFALGAKQSNIDANIHFAWTAQNPDTKTEKDITQSLIYKNCDVIAQKAILQGVNEIALENDILMIGSSDFENSNIIDAPEPKFFSYFQSRARDIAENTYKANDAVSGWMGMETHVVKTADFEMLTEEQKNSVDEKTEQMTSGKWDVFTGPIKDIYGATIVPEGLKLPDNDLFYMLWYVSNIVAMPPPMG